jgi:serine/threonine protein kinase
VSGLKFLHHKLIIHRDIKPGNLLLTQSNRIKIADFGLAHMKVSRGFASRPYGVCGTPCYTAPEVLRNEKYGMEADIFSLGIILCQMMTGSYPFSSVPVGVPKAESSLLDKSFEERILQGERPKIPVDCLPDLKDLIERCWSQDPKDRPPIDEIMKSLSLISRKLDIAVQEAFDDLLDDMPPETRKVFEELQTRMQETESELEAVKSELLQARDAVKNVS